MTRGPAKRSAAAQIEGRHPVLEALRAGRRVLRVLVADNALGTEEIVSAAKRAGVRVERVAPAVIAGRAQGQTAQGVIALVPEFAYARLQDVARRDDLLLVAADGITDPHNLGALARSACAAGAHGLVIAERRASGVTPVVEKAAAGALSHMPVVRVTNLATSLQELQKDGVWVVALDAEGDCTIWELPVASQPVCLVVGAEGRGVSRLVRERADVVASIPMPGPIASLNASVAGALALFEVVRRRAGS